MKTPSFLGSNITRVKGHNLKTILLSLLHTEKISRVELARQTSLSTTTITNLTGELLGEGIIVEEESILIANERRSIGRPRTMLRLVPDARYAVGVHIGIGLYRVAVVNLHAKIVHNNIANFDLETTPETVLADIAQLVQQTVIESKVDVERIIGVGIGASGLVDFETGINVFGPRLGWRDIAVAQILETALGLPVCVDNNVRTMALAEAFFGAGQGVGSLVFVYGRMGVGSGVVMNGEIFRGSGAGAGEIGHMVMRGESGEKCTCGSTGCLETLVSEAVLINQAQELAAQKPDGILAHYLQDKPDAKIVDQIFAAACDGDEATKQLIFDLAKNLGIALSNLVNILNPELIILGGMFAQGCDLILPVAEDTMRATAFAGLGENVRIQTTSFGWQAGVTGAAALALTSYFYQNTKEE
jgi:glucokinase-like ROK family protein